MTIKEAIKAVLKNNGNPMTATEIYDEIVRLGLYDFKAAIPSAIVRGELRRHCVGVDFPSASRTKHFKLIDDNKYFYLPKPIHQKRSTTSISSASTRKSDLGVSELKLAQERHKSIFKETILKQIKKISPENFEHFTKNLLLAYGFEDVEVTSFRKDGGIDGFGQLQIGLGLITVAFQCKRYTNKPVSTKEIQEFRGSIQGKCEQGLFFTTSKFTNDCKNLMFQPGAVPIIMIDGEGIVTIMLDKNFGIKTETIPYYVSELDLALEGPR